MPINKPWLDLGSEDLDQHKALGQREAFEEKLRLLYVGLTRARNRCYVVWGNVGLKDNRGYTISDGLAQSALAWLLHPVKSETDDPLEAQKEQLKSYDHQTLLADISQLCIDQPAVFAIQDAPKGRLGLKAEPSEPLLFKPYHGKTLYPTWRVASFSGLTSSQRHHATEGPDHDSQSSAPEISTERSIFSFPEREAAATVAGTCLHAILEEWDWQNIDALNLEVSRQLERHGIPPHWLEVVSQMVQNTVGAALDGKALRLRDIPVSARVAEMEFTYAVGHCKSANLIAALQHSSLPTEFKQAAQQLDFFHINGFLRGFIDLVFEYQGAYYVLDYKSNWLGNSIGDYHQLIPAMAQHHYYLQYLIYSAAVRRFLHQRLPHFSDDQFGGVYYLFMRGMGEKNGQSGVYFNRPSMELLDQIEAALMGDRVHK